MKQPDVQPVTVGIPAYNAQAYLKRAVDSVRKQNWPIAEILVVDDGSADGTGQLARALGCRVIVHSVNRGDAAARNTILENAATELLAWLDADDEWMPHHLETVVPALLAEASSAGAYALTLAQPSGDLWEQPAASRAGEALLTACLFRCLLPQNTLVVRRERVLSSGAYCEQLRVASDYDLWCRLATRYDLVCVPVVTAIIHEHPNQSSKQGFRYTQTEYTVRRQYLASPDVIGTTAVWLEQKNHEIWQQHLATSWHLRDARALLFHCSEFSGHGTLLQAMRARTRLLLIPVALLADWMRNR